MKKIKEFIAEYLNKAIGGAATAAFAYFATLGHWFCNALGVNGIYCDPFMIRSEMFLIGGALIAGICMSVRLISRRVANIAAVILFGVAVVCAIILPVISRQWPLPREPEELIEFHRVVPLQLLAGIILCQILIWIFDYIGPDFKDYLRKQLGLTNNDIT
jgi:hypothetical protein